jgi:hypothetical protein
MVVHRDHGWSDGWGTPGYGTGDVQALTNGDRLPVVLSVNCSSGAYDYDETSFAGEALVKANGGAVGVFGDTRDSPSTANTQMSLGFVDALLPSVLSGEGPATKQRTGDALNWGKMRLNGIAPLPNGTTQQEFYLWHYYGDPSMQMWGGGSPPLVFNAAVIQAIYKAKPSNPGDPPPYEVIVSKLPAELVGQPISLLNKGDVVGKTFVNGDGTATIQAAFGDGSVKPGDLKVAAEGDGAQPFEKQVDGVVEDTTLSQQCPQSVGFNAPATVSGKLAPGFAGATISVTWTRPGGRGSFTRTTQTNSKGEWNDTIDTGDDDPDGGGNGGVWQVSSSFAGDSSHNPSSAEACSFFEQNG